MKRRKYTERIIFHHSASGPTTTLADIREWHLARNFEDIGYHFVIPCEGKAERGRDLHAIGAHANGRNADSIGVCMIGHFGEYGPTDNQINEAAQLYHGLCRAYSKKLLIEFHHEQCPGKLLDRAAFAKTLEDTL